MQWAILLNEFMVNNNKHLLKLQKFQLHKLSDSRFLAMINLNFKYQFDLLLSFSLLLLQLLLLLLELVSFNVFASLVASLNDPPVIFLGGYIEADALQYSPGEESFISNHIFKNDFLAKNGSDYIVSESVRQVAFGCHSSYPITWTFPNSENLPNEFFRTLQTEDTRRSTLFENTIDPLSYAFTSHLLFPLRFYTFFSANLTCQSADTILQLQSSVHIFYNGKDEIENVGKTVNVSVRESHSDHTSFTIPCRPSLPDITLLLEQQLDSGTPREKWISISNYFSFSPKIGFTYIAAKPKVPTEKSPSIMYRCSVLSSQRDGDKDNNSTKKYAYFNVSSTSEAVQKEVTPFQRKSNLKEEATIEMEKMPVNIASYKYYTLRLKCCSGTADKPARIYPFNCLTPLSCKYRKEHIPKNPEDNLKMSNAELNALAPGLEPESSDSNGCDFLQMMFSYELVSCSGENVEYLEEYIHVFHPASVGPVANRTHRLHDAGQSGALTHYINNDTNIPVAQKMMIFASRKVEAKSLQSRKLKVGLPIMFDGGVLQHTSIVGTQEDADAVVKDYRKILGYYVEYDRDVYYEGEPLTFLCVGVKIYYETGAHMRLNWKNDSKLTLDQFQITPTINEGDTPPRQFYLSGGDFMFNGDTSSIEHVFGTSITAEQNMHSVDCWMPVAGSAKWDKISKIINVLPSVAPKFQEPESEIMYLYLGDTNMRVYCTIVEASPVPDIEVFKNGKNLLLRKKTNATKKWMSIPKHDNAVKAQIENGMQLQVNFYFSNVLHTHQGLYECNATNVNGTVKRTVQIFVLERTRVAIPIAGTIIGLLCLVLVILALNQWRNRKLVRR